MDKYDIDEVLFVKALYRASRTQLKNFFEGQMENIKKKIETTTDIDIRKNNEEMLSQIQRNKEINNTCYFYCVTLYFALKNLYADSSDGTFDYGKYYGNTKDAYKNSIIQSFADKFFAGNYRHY